MNKNRDPIRGACLNGYVDNVKCADGESEDKPDLHDHVCHKEEMKKDSEVVLNMLVIITLSCPHTNNFWCNRCKP